MKEVLVDNAFEQRDEDAAHWINGMLKNVPILVGCVVGVSTIAASYAVSQYQISDLRQNQETMQSDVKRTTGELKLEIDRAANELKTAHQFDHDALLMLVQDVKWIRREVEKNNTLKQSNNE